MSTLPHVLRSHSPARNWALAVTELAAADPCGQTCAWLELYRSALNKGESWAENMLKVSQCDFLMQQVLREVEERRSFVVVTNEAVSVEPTDTASVAEEEDDDDSSHFEPKVDLSKYLPRELADEIARNGVTSSLIAGPASKNSEESTPGFNILFERVKQSSSIQNRGENPIDTTRRLLAEFGAVFLYSIADRDFPAAIFRRRAENSAKHSQPAPVGDVREQARLVRGMIEKYLEDEDLETDEAGVDEIFVGLCTTTNLDVLARLKQEQFNGILGTFFDQQAAPSQPINAIPTADGHKLRPIPDKVRPEPHAPEETPESSVGPSPFHSRAGSVVPSPTSSRAGSVVEGEVNTDQQYV